MTFPVKPWVDSDPFEIVASASTVAVLPSTHMLRITGGTTVNTITPTFAGHVLFVYFSFTATLADSVGNLLLGSNFTGSTNRCIVLGCDGTNWLEGGRSTN